MKESPFATNYSDLSWHFSLFREFLFLRYHILLKLKYVDNDSLEAYEIPEQFMWLPKSALGPRCTLG